MPRFLLVAFTTLAMASMSMADTFVFDVAGNNAGQTNTARITFSYDGINKIDINVENTSPSQNVENGPHISGFAFNVPNNVTGISSFTGPTGWAHLFDNGDINPSDNVGVYDVCAETQGANANCNGGGPVGPRLIAGEDADFSFVLSGSNLNTLTALSFLNIINPGGPSDTRASYFAVRFQTTGRTGGGSDMGVATGPPRPEGQIPEPSSVLLLSTVTAGVYFLHRRMAA